MISAWFARHMNAKGIIGGIALFFFFTCSVMSDAWAALTPTSSPVTKYATNNDTNPSTEFDIETFSLPANLGTISEVHRWNDELVMSHEPCVVSNCTTRDTQRTTQNAQRKTRNAKRKTHNAQRTMRNAKRATHNAQRTTIIHIQDAHCNYAAQKKIAEIVEYLNEEYGITTVNLEGGKGNYDISAFTDVTDKSMREKVSDYFVQEGLVTGAEYYAINNPEKIKLWGIEDEDLYRKNLKVYRQSLEHKDEIDNSLKSLSQVLSKLKKHVYTEDLKELDQKHQSYKSGDIEFKEYLAYLVKTVKDEGIRIKDEVFLTLPNIALLSESLRHEGQINFKKANNERDVLIDRLQKILSDVELEELVLKTVQFKKEILSPKDFYAYLTGKARSVNINLAGFTNLYKYLKYQTAYNSVDKSQVMREMKIFEEQLIETLSINDKQKELYLLSRNLALMKNFFDVKLTKDEYSYYKENKDSFRTEKYISFIKKEAALRHPACPPKPRRKREQANETGQLCHSERTNEKGQLCHPERANETGQLCHPERANEMSESKDLDENLKTLNHHRTEMEQFYEYSFNRDKAFLKNLKFKNDSSQASDAKRKTHNTKRKTHDAKRTTQNTQRTTILITGGFHTENLCDLFKQNNISYISIMPSFKNEDEYQSPYFNLLAGAKSALWEIIDSDSSAIAICSMFSEMKIQGVPGKTQVQQAVELLKTIEQGGEITLNSEHGLVTFSNRPINEFSEQKLTINNNAIYATRQKPSVEKMTSDIEKLSSGAWFSNPTYTRWFAWWVEPAVAFWAAGKIYGGADVWTALLAGGIFWGAHVFRAVWEAFREDKEKRVPFFSRDNILINRNILLLSFLTTVAGLTWNAMQTHNVVTWVSLGAMGLVHLIINLRSSDKEQTRSIIKRSWILSWLFLVLFVFTGLTHNIINTISTSRIYYFSFDQKRVFYNEIRTRYTEFVLDETFDSQELIKQMRRLQNNVSATERQQAIKYLRKEFKHLGQRIVASSGEDKPLPEEARETFSHIVNFVKNSKWPSVRTVSEKLEIDSIRTKGLAILNSILMFYPTDDAMAEIIVDTFGDLLAVEEPFTYEDPLFDKFFPYINAASLLSTQFRYYVYLTLSSIASITNTPTHIQKLASQRMIPVKDVLRDRNIYPAMQFLGAMGTLQQVEENKEELRKIKKSPTQLIPITEIESIREWRSLPPDMRKFCMESATAYGLPPELLINDILVLKNSDATNSYSVGEGLEILAKRQKISKKIKNLLLICLPRSLERHVFSSEMMDFLGGVVAGGKNTMGIFQMRPAQVRRYKAWKRFGINADKLSDRKISWLLLDNKYAIEAHAVMIRGMINDVTQLRNAAITQGRLPGDIINYKEATSIPTHGIASPPLTVNYYKLLPNPEIFGRDDWAMLIYHPLYVSSFGYLDFSVQKKIIQSGILDNKPAEIVDVTTEKDIQELKKLLKDEDSYLRDAAERTLKKISEKDSANVAKEVSISDQVNEKGYCLKILNDGANIYDVRIFTKGWTYYPWKRSERGQNLKYEMLEFLPLVSPVNVPEDGHYSSESLYTLMSHYANRTEDLLLGKDKWAIGDGIGCERAWVLGYKNLINSLVILRHYNPDDKDLDKGLRLIREGFIGLAKDAVQKGGKYENPADIWEFLGAGQEYEQWIEQKLVNLPVVRKGLFPLMKKSDYATMKEVIGPDRKLDAKEEDIISKSPTGGSWFANPTYTRYFAWWVEPAVSFAIGSFAKAPYGGWIAALFAALIFWIPHGFQGKEKLFSSNVGQLTALTFVASLPLYVFELQEPLTIVVLGVLTVVHFVKNWQLNVRADPLFSTVFLAVMLVVVAPFMPASNPFFVFTQRYAYAYDLKDSIEIPPEKPVPVLVPGVPAKSPDIILPLDPDIWKAQSWSDTQAVDPRVGLSYDDSEKALVGTVNLEAGHPNRDRGEIACDVKHFDIDPFNFEEVKIVAEVKIEVEEGSFGGTAKRPDGIGIFVKTGRDQGWSNMYDWENISPAKIDEWQTIEFSFKERKKRDIVYTQPGFPEKNPMIQMIGIKIGAGAGTGSKFKGKFFVRNVRIQPLTTEDAIPEPTFWPGETEPVVIAGTMPIPVTSDWTARDMEGNRAVQEVFAKDGVLALKVKFKGGDPFGDFNKGEAYLLMYDKEGNRIVDIPGLSEKGFLNWEGKVIRADFWAPTEFAEGKTIPSAVLIGSHDSKDYYQNGSWQEGLITRDRTAKWDGKIKYYPSDPKENNPGYTDPQYNAKKGKEIIIKVGLPGSTSKDYEYDGYIYAANFRVEEDDRRFDDPVPEMIWTEPFAKVPVNKPPVPAAMFREWSGASGYGKFDYDLTERGHRALAKKLDLMPPEARLWRHMALYGSLPPGGAIVFDKDDTPLGFADPETGEMGANPLDKLPQVLAGVDGLLSEAGKRNKKVVLVFIAHDAADGMTEKEGRQEGDHPRMLTSAKKFAKFLELQRPVLEHIRDNWADVVTVVELLNEPLNADTNKVPIPFIQRRIDEFNRLAYEINPKWYISIGMRDTNSWGYFAHMTLPEYIVGGETIKNPYYKQVLAQSHWYADKEQDTPLATNVGKFFLPDYIIGWLKGEVDMRGPEVYKAGFGLKKVLKIAYENGYMGVAGWVDRPGEFWIGRTGWQEYSHFIRNILPKRAPFAKPRQPFRFSDNVWQEFKKLLQDKGRFGENAEGLYQIVKEHGLSWTDAKGKRHWIEEVLKKDGFWKHTKNVWAAALEAFNAKSKNKVEDIAELKSIIAYHEDIHARFRDTKYKELISHFKAKLEKTFGVSLTEKHPFITAFRKTYGKPHIAKSEIRNPKSEINTINWYLEEFLTLSIQEREVFKDSYAVLDRMAETAEGVSKEYLHRFAGSARDGLDSVFKLKKEIDSKELNRLKEFRDEKWAGYLEAERQLRRICVLILGLPAIALSGQKFFGASLPSMRVNFTLINLGIAIFVLGLLLNVWVRGYHPWSAEGLKNRAVPDSLVTEGPYAYSGHPIYLSFLVSGLGWTLGAASATGFAGRVLVSGFFVRNFMIADKLVKIEEDELLIKFGYEYRRFSESVHRWIPKIQWGKIAERIKIKFGMKFTPEQEAIIREEAKETVDILLPHKTPEERSGIVEKLSRKVMPYSALMEIRRYTMNVVLTFGIYGVLGMGYIGAGLMNGAGVMQLFTGLKWMLGKGHVVILLSAVWSTYRRIDHPTLAYYAEGIDSPTKKAEYRLYGFKEKHIYAAVGQNSLSHFSNILAHEFAHSLEDDNYICKNIAIASVVGALREFERKNMSGFYRDAFLDGYRIMKEMGLNVWEKYDLCLKTAKKKVVISGEKDEPAYVFYLGPMLIGMGEALDQETVLRRYVYLISTGMSPPDAEICIRRGLAALREEGSKDAYEETIESIAKMIAENRLHNDETDGDTDPEAEWLDDLFVGFGVTEDADEFEIFKVAKEYYKILQYAHGRAITPLSKTKQTAEKPAPVRQDMPSREETSPREVIEFSDMAKKYENKDLTDLDLRGLKDVDIEELKGFKLKDTKFHIDLAGEFEEAGFDVCATVTGSGTMESWCTVTSPGLVEEEAVFAETPAFDGINLWEDPGVIEMANDLEANGLQIGVNFDKLEDVPSGIREGRGILGIFKHRGTGVEIIGKDVFATKELKEFLAAKPSMCCPAFLAGIGDKQDVSYVFELNLYRYGYETLDKIIGGLSTNMDKETRRSVHDAISKTFMDGNNRFLHGDLHTKNILAKQDDAGNLTDIKIIDWKEFSKRSVRKTADLNSFLNGDRSDLVNADIKEVLMEGLGLRGVDMENADLSRAELTWADLSGASLMNTTLERTVLMYCGLQKVDFRDAKMKTTFMVHADLSGADLSGAIVYNSFFNGSNLSYTNFTGADLKMSKFEKADMSGADLRGAKNINADMFSKTVLKTTKFDAEIGKEFEDIGFIVKYADNTWCEVTSVPLDMYGAAEELIPAILDLTRKAPTYAIEPTASLEVVSPVIKCLRDIERKTSDKGHHMRIRSYLADGDWENNMIDEIDSIFPEFYKDLTTFEGLQPKDNKTRMVIRIPSLPGGNNSENKNGIIAHIKKKLTDSDNSLSSADIDEIVAGKIRFVTYLGEAVYLNTVIDLFTDLTLVECDRYGKDDGYPGDNVEKANPDLASKLRALLYSSVTNFNDVSGISLIETMNKIFNGDVILAIRKVDWKDIDAWKRENAAVITSL